MKYLYFFTAILFLFPSTFVLAHQPYLVDGEKQIVINEPEISKAYYGELTGTPVTFLIREDKPFNLYVNLLVPAIMGIPTDISAEIKKGNEKIAFLEASSTDWVRTYEPFAGDDYYKGPEWRSNATSGAYTITVSRPENWGRYVLAVGEKESFTLDEMLRTIGLLPSLKSDFFNKPAWTAYFNRIGAYMALAFLLVLTALFILGEIFRHISYFFHLIFKKVEPKRVHD